MSETLTKLHNLSKSDQVFELSSGVGTYLSGTARAVPLLKVGRLVMHFAVPLFGHRLHIALMIDGRTVLCSRGVYISHCQ